LLQAPGEVGQALVKITAEVVGVADSDLALVRIVTEQVDFVRSYSKSDGRLADVGAVDLILDAISGLMGNPHRFR
jgi:hypothetical protein